VSHIWLKEENLCRVLVRGNLKERELLEDLVIDGNIILKWVSKKLAWDGVD
jgi:hypothetical protein